MMQNCKQFLLLSVILVSQAQTSSLELKQVIVHTRHGARAPMYDVLSDYSWWLENYAPEELTTVGQRQHLLLGSKLKRLYQDILPQYLNETLVDVYSTESPRAVRSAQSFILGLYPLSSPAKQQQLIDLDLSLPPGYYDEDLKDIIKRLKDSSLPNNHQTFPQMAPFDYTDSLLSPEDVCPRIDMLRKDAFQAQQYKDFENKLWEGGFYKRFVNVFQEDLIRKGILCTIDKQHSELNMTVIGWFYDSLVCNQYGNREFPPLLDNRLYREILFVYDVQNVWKNFPSAEVIKLTSSQHARQIVKLLDNYIGNNSPKKFILFSGHDGDVNTMLQFLHLQLPTFDFDVHEKQDDFITHTNAPFASSIIFELYQDSKNGSYSIQTIYNGKVQLLQFCQNQTMCSIQDFKNHFFDNSYSLEEWTEECNKINYSYSQ